MHAEVVLALRVMETPKGLEKQLCSSYQLDILEVQVNEVVGYCTISCTYYIRLSKCTYKEVLLLIFAQ